MRSTPPLLFAALIVGVFAAAPATAADKPPEPKTFKMSVHAQATTRPALAIRLLPSLTDQTPGDAAPVYLLAATLWNRESNKAEKEPSAETIAKFGLRPSDEAWTWSAMLMEAPLAKLKSPELHEYLNEQQSVLEMLEIASLREECHWDLPFREQGFRTLLPHLQALRGAARVVCVKARSQLAVGDVAGAIRTLRTNFALARALNHQAVLIQSLVGASISAVTLEVVREAAGLPGSPNLYWTLSELPKPLFDLHIPMEWERSALYYSIPQLRKVRDGTFTETDWREVMRMFDVLLSQEGSQPKAPGLIESLALAGKTAMMYVQARKYLIDRGMSAEDVDALPKPLALGRYLVESFNEVYDEITKWTALPYWQAREGLARAEQELKTSVPQGNPLLLIVPAVNRAMFSIHRLDRDLAATQAAEALRDYAGRHNGSLPKSLDEVTETPVPLDPIWGKPFAYKVDGATATLESAAPPGGSKADSLIVTVTVVK